jgi:methionine aminopeptidase
MSLRMGYQTSELPPAISCPLPSVRSPVFRWISRPLHDGDIVNVDITVYLDGYHGDTSDTYLVGQVVNAFDCHSWLAPSHYLT